jgi:hypothetical protein
MLASMLTTPSEPRFVLFFGRYATISETHLGEYKLYVRSLTRSRTLFAQDELAVLSEVVFQGSQFTLANLCCSSLAPSVFEV